MSVSPDAYRTQLDDNMVQFYLILERYRQAFIVAQASGNYPNDSQFQEAKSLLESRFRDLFIVESQVLGGIDGNNAEIVSLNDRIAMVEGIYNGENAALQQKKAASEFCVLRFAVSCAASSLSTLATRSK